MGDIPASDLDASRPDVPSLDSSEREVTVLITGFGPFLDEFPVNPSWEIARRLPATLALALPAKRSPSPSPAESIKINILTPRPPNPLRVSYHPTSATLPHLLATLAPDAVLHVGLAAGRDFFAVERSSARLGYARNDDVDGRRWTAGESEEAWPGARFPERLETGLEFAAVWEGWREGCCGGSGGGSGGNGVEGVVAGDRGGEGEGGRRGRRTVAIRPSDNVGSYLCGFSYYTSLAWFWAREREREEKGEGGAEVERPVLFLHVPACPEEEDVEQGKEITEELIKAMVRCWVAQKERKKKEREAVAAA